MKPRPWGPIVLVLQNATIHNAAISKELIVLSRYTGDFHIVECTESHSHYIRKCRVSRDGLEPQDFYQYEGSGQNDFHQAS